MQPIPPPYRKTIFVCVNDREPGGRPACGNRGSYEVFRAIKQAMRDRGLNEIVRVSRTRCLDLCEHGPNVAIFPEDTWYTAVRKEDVPEILARHVPDGWRPDRPRQAESPRG